MSSDRENLDFFYADGTVSIREVLNIVFYIRKPHLEIRDRAERTIWRFVALVSIDALAEYYNNEGEQEKLTIESLRSLIHERFFGEFHAPNAILELVGQGVYAPDYKLRYYGSAINAPGLESEVCYISCWVPRKFYQDNREKIFGFIKTLASDLPYSFAYVSLGLAGEDDVGKQALAARFPGLDISYQGSMRTDLCGKAAGSYWLTLLGQDLCEQIGGVKALRAALPDEVLIAELPIGGCFIQLSDEPEIGDVNRGNSLPANKALARFFQDKGVLHVPEKVAYFVNQQGLADREAQRAWHKRFLI